MEVLLLVMFHVWRLLGGPVSFLMLNLILRQLFDGLCCFKHCCIQIKCHPHSKHDLLLMFLGKSELPPPANIGWSINKSRISGVGQCRLEYELQKILGVSWGTNYISHCYPLAVLLRVRVVVKQVW